MSKNKPKPPISIDLYSLYGEDDLQAVTQADEQMAIQYVTDGYTEDKPWLQESYS